MRRWHRLIAPYFAVLLLVIAVTGVITRAVQSLDRAAPAAHAMKPAGAVALCKPEKPKRTPLGQFGHFVKDIHSGEALGPVGVVLALASGLALCFFAASGLWMYWQMWKRQSPFRRGR